SFHPAQDALPHPFGVRFRGESSAFASFREKICICSELELRFRFLLPRGLHTPLGLMQLKPFVATGIVTLSLLASLTMALTTTEPSSTATRFSSTEKTTEKITTTASTTSSTTTTTTGTPPPTTSTEWQDMDEVESQKLVDFVVGEIQKLKMEHKELDECQELNLSSVLSGKKLAGKITKYSVTLKVQPQIKNTESCLQQNSTITNMHPEICEADVTEGDHGGTEGKTLLRSTCLQVEELQD
ncbi:unnamed protein product, partial [Larinioides sclopetarius]